MVTEREGGSQLCAVKGREVSIVREAVVSEEIGRWRVKAAEKGLKRLVPLEEEDKRDRAISIRVSNENGDENVWGCSREL